MQLRPYQQKAIEETRALIVGGSRRILVVAPTGSGKSVLAGFMTSNAVAKGHRVMAIAHRRELIRQLWIKLVRAGVDPRDTGLMIPKMKRPPDRPRECDPTVLTDDQLWDRHAFARPNAKVIVGSVQTICRKDATPQCDILIIDEAHRTSANSYQRVIDAQTNPVVIGFTATPVRTDNKGLHQSYDQMVVVAQYQDLVESGHLTPCDVVYIPPDDKLPDLGSVKVRGSDYEPASLSAACDRKPLVTNVVEQWQKHGNGAPTIAFCSSVLHSHHLADEFSSAGIEARALSGESSLAYREDTISGLRDGRIQVVTNVDVLTEGADIPCVKTIILARPTMSLRVYLQMVGRGSRPFDGPHPFTILDHAWNFRKPGFGWPQDYREWALKPKRKRKKKDEGAGPPTKDCPECLAIVHTSCKECPGCGYAFAVEVAETIEADLIEVRPNKSPKQDDSSWDAIVKEWQARNNRRSIPLDPKWCLKKYKGDNPGPLPVLSPERQGKLDRFRSLWHTAMVTGRHPGWVHAQLKKSS